MSEAIINLKMAMPLPGEQQALYVLLQQLEMIVKGEIKELDGDLSRYEAVRSLIHEYSEKFSYFRVIYAGMTAINNACDKSQEVLEFKPEIKEAMRLAELYRVDHPEMTISGNLDNR